MTAVAEPQQKPRFLYADALPIAKKFVQFLEPHCTRVVIAGSLRREKQLVSDIEILFVSKPIQVPDQDDMFGGTITVSAAGRAIEALLAAGVICKRENKKGAFTWGEKNKLAVHIESGIPVDFFATDEDCFFNALVVRTGPSELNKQIAQLALDRGWDWHAYGNGFTRGKGQSTSDRKIVKSERDVFAHVGLLYQEPKER